MRKIAPGIETTHLVIVALVGASNVVSGWRGAGIVENYIILVFLMMPSQRLLHTRALLKSFAENFIETHAVIIMILKFRYASGPAKPIMLEQAKQHLTDTVCEIFADRPRIDLVLAISTGHRELERGTPFFEAVEVAENVIRRWGGIVDDMTRALLIVRRNRMRLKAYQNRKAALPEL